MTKENAAQLTEEVGETAVRQLLKGKAEIIPGFTNKLHAFLLNFIPDKITTAIAGRLYNKESRQQHQSNSFFNNTNIQQGPVAIE